MPEDQDRTNPPLADLIREIAGEPVTDIASDTRLSALDNWTSLAGLRLLSSIESDLGVWLDLRDYLAAETVGDIDAMVRNAQLEEAADDTSRRYTGGL